LHLEAETSRFTYAETEFSLKITDPTIERDYGALKPSAHKIGRAMVCVSSSEEIGGNVIRLIATILTSSHFEG